MFWFVCFAVKKQPSLGASRGRTDATGGTTGGTGGGGYRIKRLCDRCRSDGVRTIIVVFYSSFETFLDSASEPKKNNDIKRENCQQERVYFRVSDSCLIVHTMPFKKQMCIHHKTKVHVSSEMCMGVVRYVMCVPYLRKSAFSSTAM